MRIRNLKQQQPRQRNQAKILQELQQSKKKSNSDNYELSIVGVKNLTDGNLSSGRKFLWIIALLTCCGFVLYYVTNRVIYILSFPTQVGVTLKQNESLLLPQVTLCPNTPFHPTNLDNLGMTKDGLPGPLFTYQNGFNVTDLWREISPNSSHYIIGTSVSSKDTLGNWKETFTSTGLCQTHTYEDEIQASGLNFGMSIQINWEEIFFIKALSDREGIRMFFHTANDQPLTEIEGINIAPREDVSIAIRIKAFKSLSRKEHPCVSIEGYSRSKCVNKCFNQELGQLTGCRLPFMADINNIPWCNNLQLYQDAFRTFWKKSKGNLTLWAKCGEECLIECNKLVYAPYIESVTDTEKNQGKFLIYFPEMWYEIVEEKNSYDIIALLCDVGGTFGLFLGCSILTLVELIESLAYYFYYRKNESL